MVKRAHATHIGGANVLASELSTNPHRHESPILALAGRILCVCVWQVLATMVVVVLVVVAVAVGGVGDGRGKHVSRTILV